MSCILVSTGKTAASVSDGSLRRSEVCNTLSPLRAAAGGLLSLDG